MVVALVCVALTSLEAIDRQERDALPRVQERDALLAFRFDSQRVVATIKGDLNLSIPQLARGASQPLAKYGYHIFDLPAALETGVPSWVRAGDRWTLHAAPGQTFDAVVERFVLGEGQCSRLLAVVMKIDDQQAWAFSRVRSKYYLGEAAPRRAVAGGSSLGELPASAVSPQDRRLIAKTLAALVAREVPKVRGAALSFDAQAYRLTPDGVPRIFVRAFWRAGEQQVFAAALWVRADSGEVVWSDLRPAAWLRMPLFQGRLVPEQLGQVLNVVDRDADGWAEVIFGHVGYEGRGISLLEVRSGFTPTGIEYGYGC
jgi:hypothetical protein